MKVITKFLIVLLIFLSIDLKAQNFEVGFESGYGRTGSQTSYPYSPFLKIFDSSHSDFFREGLVCFYTPDSAMFSIKTGLLYCKKKTDILSSTNHSLKILQLPIGCDIRFGKKYFLLFGCGLDINYLTSWKSNNTSFPLFQIGANANIGLGFVVYKNWCFDCKYQIGYDISKLYNTEYISNSGDLSRETYRSINGILSLSLRYRIF